MDNLASAVHTVYLSEKTFDYYVTNFENQGILVLFYVPLDDTSEILKRKFFAAATKLKEKGIEGKLAIVDCSKNIEWIISLGIISNPALIYYKREHQKDCNYLQEEQAIIDFVIFEEKKEAKRIKMYKKAVFDGMTIGSGGLEEEYPVLDALMKQSQEIMKSQRIQNLYVDNMESVGVGRAVYEKYLHNQSKRSLF